MAEVVAVDDRRGAGREGERADHEEPRAPDGLEREPPVVVVREVERRDEGREQRRRRARAVVRRPEKSITVS